MPPTGLRSCAPPLSIRRLRSTLPGVGSDSPVLDAGKGTERLSLWENKVVAMLQTYKEMHGNLLVPRNFVVPIEDESWPSIAWGYRLGDTVSGLRVKLNGRTRKSSPLSTNLVEKLDAMGFIRDPTQFKWDAMILPSLDVFKQEFGHCLVGRPFIVPKDPKWPRVAWGLKLGSVVNTIRDGECYVEQVTRDEDRLAQIGFAWNKSRAMWDSYIISSLEVYFDLFKHCRIPHRFVVPAEEPWPRTARGTLRLGSVLGDMRSRGTYFAYYGRDVEKLDELGLNLNFSAQAWKDRVVPLLDIYSTISEANEIPEDFVIPSKAPWPEEMWGVRLGLIVARNAQHLPRA